ncbi:SH3 domain-containing protein [Bacteroides fragilis]
MTAPNGLNVRASANKNGEVLGQLSQDNVIDVISIENGWAKFNYNGWQGYVSASYLEAVTDTGATGDSAKEES